MSGPLGPDAATLSGVTRMPDREVIVLSEGSIARARYRDNAIFERRHHAKSPPVKLAKIGEVV